MTITCSHMGRRVARAGTETINSPSLCSPPSPSLQPAVHFFTMDKTTSIVAAFNAGKQPSQHQINAWIDALLSSDLLQVGQSPIGGELSESGVKLAKDARKILQAYKAYGSSKNADNHLQEALYQLTQADVSASSLNVDAPMDREEATRDYRAVASSLRTSLQVLWTNATTEGGGVFTDFASFLRLSVADAAEAVSNTAAHTADSLRQTEDEVQSGDRDAVGRKRKSHDDDADADVKVKFEKGMDSAKVAGSSIIGAGQEAKAKADDMAAKSSQRLTEMCTRIAKRAQEDEQYRKSLDTIFDLVQKWLTLTEDAAAGASQETSLDSFIHDPTPDKHLINALRSIRTLVENIAGGKSLEDLFAALRKCVLDIRRDKDLQSLVNDFLAFAKKSFATVGLEDAQEQERENLKGRWKELTEGDTESAKRWKEDVGRLRSQVEAFEDRVLKDVELQKIRKAHAQFGNDLQETLFKASATGLQLSLDHASWVWQDAFNVYLPRLLSLVQSVPIPRTEYKDPQVEFVLEDLDISSFSILPGHVFIRNITDIDITAPENRAATTAVGSLTHVHVKALQLSLREVSFYYQDKTASLGPSEFTGLVEVTLPPQGIDVDIKFRMIPNTSEGLKMREQRGGYHRIERVDVQVSEDVAFAIKQSNHPVLVSVFKPIFNARLRDTLQTVLREQICATLEWADGMAWDVGRRAEVFSDAGLGPGASLAAAFWSELGRMKREEGGLFSGWRAMGTGVVKDIGGGEEGGRAKFAMGAEPQVISGEKRGPKGTLSKPLGETAKESVGEATGLDVGLDADADIDMEGAASRVAGGVKEGVQKGAQTAKSFKSLIEHKREQEENRPGWSSPAFDVGR